MGRAMKRILIPLLFLSLAVATYALVYSSRDRDARSTADQRVVVYVQDTHGQAVSRAQVRTRFGGSAWQACDDRGLLVLRDLVLRPDAEWTPDAVAEAVQARAPYFTQRKGTFPAVSKDPEGAWNIHFTLQHHGVLRLSIRDSHLGKMRASIHPATTPKSSIEVMDGRSIARPDHPAAFRVYPDCEKLVVILRAERGMEAVRAATQIIELRPPGTGGLIDRLLVPKPCKPIMGRVASSAGTELPPGAGDVVIEQLGSNGARYALDAVTPLMVNGSFVAPQTGDARYAITVRSPYLEDVATVQCNGGDDVVVEGARLRPWLEIRPSDPALGGRPVRLEAESVAKPPTVFTVDGRARTVFRIPIQTSGRHVVRGVVPGTESHAPYRAEKEIDATDKSGPIKVELDWAATPFGVVKARFRESDTWKSRGAKLTLIPIDEPGTTRTGPRASRPRTLLEGSSAAQSFGRVSPGLWMVRAEFINTDTALQLIRVSVKAGDNQTVEVPRVQGSHVRMTLGHALEGDALRDTVAAIITRNFLAADASWNAQGSPYGLASSVRFRWDAGRREIVTLHALRAGEYTVDLAPRRRDGVLGEVTVANWPWVVPEGQDLVSSDTPIKRLFPDLVGRYLKSR